MKPTKPQFVIVVAAWVAITLLCVAVCQAAKLPRPLLDAQANLCEVDAGRSRGSGVYVGVGLVLTAEHLVRGKTKVVCKFFGGGTYPGVVVGQSKKYDNAYVRIQRPKEPAIRGLRLSPRDPRSGDTIWKAGYGHNPRKLFWHKGTMNHAYGGWIQFTPKSIGGDSGGPLFLVDGGECLLLGNLWGTDGRNTIGSKPSTIARTLGTYALDALDTEWYLTANCGPFGCSPRRTQIGGGLFSGGLRQRVTPKAPERRDPSGIAAVVPPLDVDTGLISAQVSAFQDDANAAIDQANAAVRVAESQLADQIESQRQSEMDSLRADIEAAKKPADPGPIYSDPREDTSLHPKSTPMQSTRLSDSAREYLPWIVILIGVIAAVVYAVRNSKKDGSATVPNAIDAGQQMAESAEKLLETVLALIPKPATLTAIESIQPPVPPLTPQPLPTGMAVPTTTERINAIVASQASIDLAAKQKTEEAASARAQNQLEATRIVEDRTSKLQQATDAKKVLE